MGAELKIKPTDLKYESKHIKPSKINDTAKVSFNFRRLYTKKKKFNYDCCNDKYFKTLIDRLKSISGMSRKEMIIVNKGKGGLRCHQIKFKDSCVTENSFGILGEDACDDAWEFQLTSNKHGRVHGYFVGDIFYIVWLDPKHELYK